MVDFLTEAAAALGLRMGFGFVWLRVVVGDSLSYRRPGGVSAGFFWRGILVFCSLITL